MATQAGDDLSLPINGKTSDVKAGLGAGLPTVVSGDRANDLDLMLGLAADQDFSIDVTSIDQVFGRE